MKRYFADGGLNAMRNAGAAPQVSAYGTTWAPGTWSGGGAGQMTTQTRAPENGNAYRVPSSTQPAVNGGGGRNHLLGSNMPNQMQQPQRLGFFNRAAPATPAPVNPMGAVYGTPAQPTMAPTNPLNRPPVAQPPVAQPPVAQPAAPAVDPYAQMYQDVLGRAPDQAGLDFWKGAFGDTIDPNERQQFVTSAQAELANASGDPYNFMYQTVLGRAPDQAGADFWRGQFGDTITPEQYNQFVQAAQPEWNQIVQNARGYARGGAVKRNFFDGGLNNLADGYGLLPDFIPPVEQPTPAPAQPAASPAPAQPALPRVAASPVGEGLAPILEKYLGAGDSSTRDELKTSMMVAREESARFDEMIRKAMTREADVPSKSEMYFRLAAALGSPTKTGRFSESASGAANVMAQHEAETRKAQQAQRAEALNLAVAQQKAKMDAAKAEASTLRQLVSQEGGERRAIGTELLKSYLASGKPQSEAGKVAADMGLTPGTPEYNQAVNKYVQDKLQSGSWYKEVMAGIAGQQLELSKGAERRKAEESTKLTPLEIKEYTEAKASIGAIEDALPMLKEALTLNDKALGTTLIDKGKYALLAQSNPADERVQATEKIRYLLGSQGLAQLRSIFGGNPTEGERAVLMKLQGAEALSPTDRAYVIKDLIRLANRRLERQRAFANDIKSGQLRIAEPKVEPAQE